MAITISNLTSGFDATDGTTADTASISPTSGSVLLITLYHRSNTNPATAPTSLAGQGTLTLSNITAHESETYNAGNPYDRMLLYTATHNAGSGAIRFNFAETNYAAHWTVEQVTGANTTTPVVQSNATQGDDGGSAAAPATTLSAFGSANNGTYSAAMHTDSIGINSNPGTGFTELADFAGTSFGVRMMSQWRDTNDTTPDCSMGQGGDTGHWIIVAAEIAEAPAGGGIPRAAMYYNRRD
jgi:hypothetical protein